MPRLCHGASNATRSQSTAAADQLLGTRRISEETSAESLGSIGS
jgi:hypothetical protein